MIKLLGKKSGFSLIELCISIVIFGVIARAIFYSNTIGYELLNSAINSQKLELLNSTFSVISTHFRSKVNKSVLINGDTLIWASVDEYVQGFYLGLVDFAKSGTGKIATKFNKDSLLAAISQSAGVDFTSEFSVAAVFSGVGYSPSDFGYFGDSTLALVRAESDDILQIKPDYKGQISGAYALVLGAYALSFDKYSGELWLYYRWRPWLGERLLGAQKALLLDGLSGVRFSASDVGVELELCIDKICARRLLL